MPAPVWPPPNLTRDIVQACLALGFARAGVARALPSDRDREYRAWITSGKHGEMAYLAQRIDERLDITRLVPGARSVIVVADQYAPRGDTSSPIIPGQGRIARYARGRDYHRVMRERLRTLVRRLSALYEQERFVSFVDTGAVLEREHAQRAGLGTHDAGPPAFVGKHTLIIDPRLGSSLLLGGIATTLELTPSQPDGDDARAPLGASNLADESPCGTCTRCIDACPTQAITPNVVDASRCVSYLTLEHSGPIAPELHAGMQSWIIGCDVCQDVCPFNRAESRADHERDRVHPAYTRGSGGEGGDGVGGRSTLPLLEVLAWRDQDRREALAQSAASRASLDMLRRNALIALTNQAIAARDPHQVAEAARQAQALASGASQMLRTTADQVLERLALARPEMPAG